MFRALFYAVCQPTVLLCPSTGQMMERQDLTTQWLSSRTERHVFGEREVKLHTHHHKNLKSHTFKLPLVLIL